MCLFKYYFQGAYLCFMKDKKLGDVALLGFDVDKIDKAIKEIQTIPRFELHPELKRILNQSGSHHNNQS